MHLARHAVVGKRLLFTALAAAAFLAIAEGAVRGLVPEARWRFRDSTDDWMPDDRLGWVQRGGLNVTTVTEFGWTVRFRTNADGLTPPTATPGRPPGVFRVMIFGDSTVVGRHVPQDGTLHAHLERALRERGIAAEVLNAGVQGYSTDQVLLRMRALLPRYRPDWAIYGLCENDLGGNVSAEAYGLAKPRFRLGSDGALVELPPPRRNHAIPRFGSGPKTWLQRAAVYRLLQPSLLRLRARFGTWQERNLLGLAPEIYYDPAALEPGDWGLLAALLREMASTSGSSEARFSFFAHPAAGEVWDPYIASVSAELGLPAGRYDRRALEHRLQAAADAADVRFCPMIDSFLSRRGQGPFHLLPRDPHCNPQGYRVSAEALAVCEAAP